MKNNLTVITTIGSLGCCVMYSLMEGMMPPRVDCCDPMNHLSKRSLFKCITSHQKDLVGDMISNRNIIMTWHDSSSCCYIYNSHYDVGTCNARDDNKISKPYECQATVSGALGPAGKVFQSNTIHNIIESILHWLPLVFLIWMIFKAIYDDKSALDDDKL